MYIVVFVTASNRDEAEKIANSLVEKKLIACANIVPDVKSIFWWEEKIDRSDEVLLIIKSQESLFDEILKTVKEIHSYDVPEVIAFPIIKGNEDYLKWIKESTKE